MKEVVKELSIHSIILYRWIIENEEYRNSTFGAVETQPQSHWNTRS
ncbi:hypothetical protein [Bacillus sp. IBL03825]|nr:hypothetical protein [Bacillus sp. IBL03825]MCR6850547.1 hypothetical protein [Bacillus sp. IBL03825]